MCDFKPGDEVVCVRAGDPLPGRYWNGTVSVGEIYIVRGVTLAPDDHPDAGAPSVLIVGAPNLDIFGRDLGYYPDRFRKVERKTDKLSLTEWLSQPSGDTDRLDKTVKRPAKTRERT